MTSLHRSRTYKIIALMLTIILVVLLTLHALKENIQLYLTPSELVAKDIKSNIRLGGLVKNIVYNGVNVQFSLTDGKNSVPVTYTGVLPSLFHEQKGAIVAGHIDKGIFIADTVLAKHDERYKPPGSKL